MSTYALTDETSIDVLIFWIESSDGAISYDELEAVNKVLDNMHYDMSTYHETISHISAMSVEHVKEIIEDAITHIKKTFTEEGKKLTYQLLETIALTGNIASKTNNEKLERLKIEFGL